MKFKRNLFLLFLLSNLNILGQSSADSFEETYQQINRKNFFEARDAYALKKTDLSISHRQLIEILLSNAFNRPEESNGIITQFIQNKPQLPDSLYLKLYQTKVDNSIKLFEYQQAKYGLENILSTYKPLLSETEIADIQNSLKIWTILENVPKQQVFITDSSHIKLQKDKAGLDNLTLLHQKDSIDFIFDTGANISTITKSTAVKLDMNIFPTKIEVGTMTGGKVKAQLAVSPQLNLGNLEIRNAVFLVLEDKDLYFQQIDYQINGILGFPIINALDEIQITRDGYFIIPKEQTQLGQDSNLALDGLTPLIFIDGMHFTFDTGANQTVLYRSYYLKHEKKIEKNYPLTKVGFAGAGGKKEFDGFLINWNFEIFNREVHLKNIPLVIEKIKEEENVYGNVGQDVIGKFNKMTINFEHMFVKFDSF